MDVLTGSRRWLGAVGVVVAATVGCAQPGGSDRSLLAPTSLSDAQTQVKADKLPDVSGPWFGEISNNGSHIGAGCFLLAQDGKDLSASDGQHTYTFKHKGSLKKDVIDYRLSITGPTGDPCAVDVSGPAEFDVVAGVISAPSLPGVGFCTTVNIGITLTRSTCTPD